MGLKLGSTDDSGSESSDGHDLHGALADLELLDGCSKAFDITRKMITRSRSRALDASVGSTWGYIPALPLPPEIVDRIFWHLDVGSYFVTLMTCKQFWVVASSRRNLLRQIQRIPGLRNGLENLSTRDLFIEFRRRACKAACGSEVMADVKGAPIPSGSIHSMSTMTTFQSRLGRSTVVLAIPHHDASVAIYSVSKDDVNLIETVRYCGPNNQFDISIHALSFSRYDLLGVLYGQDDWCCPKGAKKKCRKCSASSSVRTIRNYQLMAYEISDHSSTAHELRYPEYQPPLFRNSDLHGYPSSIALWDDLSACIAWEGKKASQDLQLSFTGPWNSDYGEPNVPNPYPVLDQTS